MDEIEKLQKRKDELHSDVERHYEKIDYYISRISDLRVTIHAKQDEILQIIEILVDLLTDRK